MDLDVFITCKGKEKTNVEPSYKDGICLNNDLYYFWKCHLSQVVEFFKQ